MAEQETQTAAGVTLEPITLPVFEGTDPVGRATVALLAGRRNIEISVRGERVVEIEKVQDREVIRETTQEEISRKYTLAQLAQILLVKMYNEAIPDQVVYDELFGTRLEDAWAQAGLTKGYQPGPSRSQDGKTE